MSRENMVNRANWRTPREELVPAALPNLTRPLIYRQWKINPEEGAIGDISKQQTQNLGRKTGVEGPPDVFANVAASTVLWGGIAAIPEGGNPVTFIPPRNSTKRVILQANAENTANPQELIVNLDSPFFPTATDRSVDLKAELTWGNGDDLSKALVDIRTGTQLTLVGTSLQIEAIYTALTGAPGGFPTINIGGAFGYGNAISRGPTFTTRIFSLPQNQNRTILVPNYAANVTVFATDQVTALSIALMIQFLDNPAGLFFGTIQQALNVNQTIPLPSVCRALVITNQNAAANAADIAVVFGLAL